MQSAPLSPLLLLLLPACGAQWQSLDAGDPYAPPIPDRVELFARRSHGHRDFPQDFSAVWEATVESLHVRGIGVPESALAAARDSGREVVLELETLWLEVIERGPGRTTVLLRFHRVGLDQGREEAREFLDEVQGRL